MIASSWSTEHGMVVRRVGPPTAPCLIWIHGLGESSVSFEPVVGALPGFHHVLVDLPGYGRSPWPERVLPLPELATHLAAWLATQPPAVVLGHSMGGVLAQLVAELATVRGIVNIDGNLTRGDCTFSAMAAAYARADFEAYGFAAIRADVYGKGATRPELRGYFAAMTLASPDVFHQHSIDLVEMSSSDTLAPRLAALPCKKLFFAGVPDGICAASRERLTALGVPWRGLEPAGHWVYLDQQAAFVDAVAAF